MHEPVLIACNSEDVSEKVMELFGESIWLSIFDKEFVTKKKAKTIVKPAMTQMLCYYYYLYC